MASFFVLLTDYVAPDGDLDGFFSSAKGDMPPAGSEAWYQVENSKENYYGLQMLMRFAEIDVRRYTVGSYQCPVMDCDGSQFGCGNLLRDLKKYPLRSYLG